MDDNFKKLRAYLIDLAVKGHSDNYETIVNYSNVDFCLSNDNSKLIKYLTEILEFEYFKHNSTVSHRHSTCNAATDKISAFRKCLIWKM